MKQAVLFLIFSAGMLPGLLFGQQTTYHPTAVKQAIYFDVTPPLRDMKLIPPVDRGHEYKEIPNKIGMKEYNHITNNAFTLPEDPLWQKQDGIIAPQSRAPIQNFEGVGNLSGVDPPDTQGDISTGAYVQVVNMNFAVYSKTGTTLYGPADLMTIWSGMSPPFNVGDGDPIVLYDQAADRWIISQFSLPSTTQNAMLVAISTTSDPTGSWYRYVFDFGDKMPDYPKFGVWPDGYYLSVNQFPGGSSWGGVGAVVLQRSQMLIGGATTWLWFSLGTGLSDPWSMLPSDWDGTTTPLTNEPNYFTYFDSWTSATDDYLKIWQMHVDWVTPSNSTFSLASTLTTAPFKPDLCSATRGQCIPQPGTTAQLESLSDRLMYRLQYRNFGSYQVMVTNHTVDVDNTGHAGIRWYELRNSGSGWAIYQQGTYAPDALHRWMGSVAMNSNGAIALGYSVSSSTTVYPGIRYTGRRASDPLGEMTISEQTVIDGGGSKTYPYRWGDYSMMSVDPSDDNTFWYTNEYILSTGTWNWHTRIASFVINNAPYVLTLPASGVTLTSATLNGTVNPNGLATNYHFEWGTTTSYGNSTPIISAGSGSSPVSVNASVSSLSTGTTYHCRLVAVNSDGTINGNDVTFVPGAAALTTTFPYTITTNSAISGGNITSDGGASVTARGVCWGTSANPTIAGSHTTDGSGTGTFTSNITGLSANTTYHVRAYGSNSTGNWYGNDITFTTVCAIYSLPFYEGFATTSIPTCWTQVDHQGNGQIWQFGVITTYGSYNPNLTGNYAFLNSDAFGSSGSQNADLVSPLLDLSGYSTVTLQFNHYFRSYSGSSGTLSYSINNGSSWTPIQTFTSSTANPAAFSQSIPAVAGQSQVKFKWNYIGSYGWYWAVDDVTITGLPTNLALTNITIPAQTNVCYNAAQIITIAGSGTYFNVLSGGNATLIAGQKIRFLPGTSVQSGGHLWAYIAQQGPYCVNPSSPVTAPLINAGVEPSAGTETILFRVYPNPTTGKFTLELNQDPNGTPVAVKIFGMMGNVVFEQEMAGVRKTEFSLGDRSNGVYFIRVMTGGQMATAKIIKQ